MIRPGKPGFALCQHIETSKRLSDAYNFLDTLSRDLRKVYPYHQLSCTLANRIRTDLIRLRSQLDHDCANENSLNKLVMEGGLYLQGSTDEAVLKEIMEGHRQSNPSCSYCQYLEEES